MRANRALCVRIFATGCLVGAIGGSTVLSYNRVYTGNWLLSPYALAAGETAPPELSFRPSRILRGIAEYGHQTLEESLIGVFPFTYLLAGYALFMERERRREVWILAAIYLSLLLAYLAHPQGSGVFFGERFHFEGIFAVFLLAARGAMLLARRWGFSRRAAVAALALLSILQVSQQAAAALAVASNGEPYRKIRSATAHAPAGVVFLEDSPGFVAKHFNLNSPDWQKAPHVFLVDADPTRRNEWACRFHAQTWTLAQYDPKVHSAILMTEPTKCGAPRGSAEPGLPMPSEMIAAGR
jgi:peptidoglycan/LPS O-acetylase OafA/YrhL